MTIPTLLKSWQFNNNQQVGSMSALPACNQNAMLTIKNSLIGFTSSAWTVWGSCDGNTGTGIPPGTHFGNADGVDRWQTTTNLVWAASGNHSWMVLQQAGFNTNTAICIDLLSTSAYSYNAAIILSPSAGFGLANGGIDGSLTARPQATDEIVLISNAAWGGYNGTLMWRLHVMMSTDGRCTRIAMQRNNASVGLWMIEEVKNPISTWALPLVALVVGNTSTTNAATYANLASADNMKGKIDSDTCTFYVTYEAYSTTGIPTSRSMPDDDTSEWAVFPVGLMQSSSPKHRGRKGELFDFWWGSDWPITADTYPDDASRVLIQHGDVILPWDGSVPWSWY